MYSLKRKIPLKRLFPAVFCLAFVFAQFTAFEHELEHDHHDHEHHASCDAFAAHSATGIAFNSSISYDTLKHKPILIINSTYSACTIGAPSFSFIRAPPKNILV